MKHFHRQLLIAVAAISYTTAAADITETRTFVVGTDIADVQNPPVSFLQTISDSNIAYLSKVVVGLNLVGRGNGGFAGEMFVSLNKDLSITSVLANNVGVTPSVSLGQPYDGWRVTLDDSASTDLHLVLQDTGVLGGTYQPDGRVLPTDSLRPELLAVFNGGAGNGDWRLNIADLEQGGTMRLESWSLTLTGAVPEASTYAAGFAVIGVAGAVWLRRRLH